MLKHFKSSPLWLIGLFIIFAQGTAGVAAVKISGWPQEALVIFVISYSTLVTAVFFAFLWHKPENFYGPSEYDKISPESFAKALKRIPKQTLDAVKNLEENPSSDDAMFELMDNIFPEDIKQHIVHMLNDEGRLNIENTDESGYTHRYEIITKQKGISFGAFSPRKFLNSLDGTNLVRLSGDQKIIHLSKRGRDFGEWLVEHGKDAETFNSSIGSWGVEQSAMELMKGRLERRNHNQSVVTTPEAPPPSS